MNQGGQECNLDSPEECGGSGPRIATRLLTLRVQF